MILGTGIDIIEVERIRLSYERFGERFLNRILTPAEYLAARFSAKEAISKAFGTGIGQHLGWQDLEVARKASGEPYVVLHGPALRLLEQRAARLVHLSLSHTEQHAAAVAILEG